MTRKIFAVVALFAAAFTLFSAYDTAEARRGGSGFHGGNRGGLIGRSYGGPRIHAGPRFHNHAPRGLYRPYVARRYLYGAAPLVGYGAYYGAYGGGCYWMLEKARYTGSPYWWQRYYACRNGGYY
jgi:hypothetical protein